MDILARNDEEDNEEDEEEDGVNDFEDLVTYLDSECDTDDDYD